jgi:PIN domain nuclease of toxin-antitoxin system
MRLLLDTHLLLWAAGCPERLSRQARSLIKSPDNELLFSAASIWEIIIKNQLGREDFKVNAAVLRRGLLNNGYDELAISSEHVVAVGTLPLLHKDPFDRVLIAQAMVEGMTLLTSDSRLSRYRESVRAV